MQQAAYNTKEQFASSPDLSNELLNAIMDALTAHNTMSRQVLESERVRSGLRDILLGPAELYQALRTGERSARHKVTPAILSPMLSRTAEKCGKLSRQTPARELDNGTGN